MKPGTEYRRHIFILELKPAFIIFTEIFKLQSQLDNYFLTLPEPEQAALLFLRHFLINEMKLQESWKFNTPFYYYNSKWFCYLSYGKKKRDIYIGFVNGYLASHPKLEAEGRKQIKIYKINPEKDIRINELTTICKLLKKTYRE